MQTYNPDGQFESVRDIDRDLITQQTLENHLPPQNPLPPPLKPINPELKGNIFREMSINRKSEGFQQFKQSEEFILTNARQHLLCSDNVIEQLDLRVLISDRSLQAIIAFLKDRIAQEQNNVKLLTHKNPSFLSIFKDQDQVIYPKFSASLEHLNQLHQAQGKSLSILVTNMEKMIKEKFETNLSAYSNNINGIVAKIKAKRKSAREQLAILTERSKKFYKLYNEMMSNGGNHKKRSKDLFNQERKFKHAMHQQITQLTQLGEDIIAYYNEIIKQESQRLEIISVGMRYYLEKFHETYSGTTPSAQVQLVLQKFKEYNSIEESSQIVFKDVAFIKDVLKSQEIGFPQIKYYLTQFPGSLLKPTMPQTNPFILKFFSRLQRDVGSVLTKWQNCLAIVSIDRNILLYDSEDMTIPNQKASIKFVLEHTQLIQKPKQPLVAELKQVTPGFMYNSKESVVIKFHSQDDYDEMQFYLANQ
ncbi:unnamed protein product (macronuclear) [Paramecium tetraurelia]|uniref:PH domain-containing protein n=1 Tax=Paramecium tetraurelia TaxID=5888 RepID=A0EIE5_PARTE|nr:uncharacterized protein GSPATT00027415001 [Paramecium tetraurelia]CAK95086.1 unnamed protein product [Paramecium tetraurelia]|eukprot:XP_001462459.1 hypothetical protein (macronuclear) [Paramecium tetraurelia strain d4-2]